MIDMDSHGLINLKLRTCLDIGFIYIILIYLYVFLYYILLYLFILNILTIIIAVCFYRFTIIHTALLIVYYIYYISSICFNRAIIYFQLNIIILPLEFFQ